MFRKSIKTTATVAMFLTVCFAVCCLLGGCAALKGTPGQTDNTQGNNGTDPTNGGQITTDPNAGQHNAAFEKLLPSRAGYNWRYNGFAEYGHTMTLLSVAKMTDETRYAITGIVDDMSGGESGQPAGSFDIALWYVIRNGSLIQEKTETRMMDSESDRIELLRGALTLNGKWSQDVVTGDGKSMTLDCEITDIKDENGVKTYTVMYKDKSSDYYEKRLIKDGIGVISFEKLWTDQDGNSHQIGYSLYPEATGYAAKIELDSYIPPLDKLLRFFGLAEYSHEGKVQLVSAGDDRSVYRFDGTYTDGSGLGGTFKVEYVFDYINGTVSEKVIENTRTGVNMLNSKISEHIVLKMPIRTGTFWQQEVTFDGGKYMMDARIISVAYKGRTEFSPELTDYDRQYPVVTVRYLVRDVSGYFNNTYIEQRRFQAVRGMLGYEHLMSGDIGISGKDLEDVYKVEEAVLMNMFGYSLSLEPLQ